MTKEFCGKITLTRMLVQQYWDKMLGKKCLVNAAGTIMLWQECKGKNTGQYWGKHVGSNILNKKYQFENTW